MYSHIQNYRGHLILIFINGICYGFKNSKFSLNADDLKITRSIRCQDDCENYKMTSQILWVLSTQKTVFYLGVELDSKLSFEAHIDNMISRSHKAVESLTLELSVTINSAAYHLLLITATGKYYETNAPLVRMKKEYDTHFAHIDIFALSLSPAIRT